MRPLRITLVVIGTFQLVVGAALLVAPGAAAALVGLTPPAPPWVDWLLAMSGVRFLGYAYGMFVAARRPAQSTTWIDTMIVIQAVDWLVTLVFLARGDLTLAQVGTVAVLPVLFVAALIIWHPRRLARSPATRPHEDPPRTARSEG